MNVMLCSDPSSDVVIIYKQVLARDQIKGGNVNLPQKSFFSPDVKMSVPFILQFHERGVVPWAWQVRVTGWVTNIVVSGKDCVIEGGTVCVCVCVCVHYNRIIIFRNACTCAIIDNYISPQNILLFRDSTQLD